MVQFVFENKLHQAISLDFAQVIQAVDHKQSRQCIFKMLQDNHSLSAPKQLLPQSCQISHQCQHRGQSGRQQNEVDYYHHQEQLQILKEDYYHHQEQLQILKEDYYHHQEQLQILKEDYYHHQEQLQILKEDYYHHQEQLQILKESYQNSFAYDEDDLQSITKESCMTGANSSMEIEPRLLLSQKTKKKKTDRMEDLRSQLLEAIQNNEQLQERIVLLESLLVQSCTKLQQLQQRKKLRIRNKRKSSF